MVLAVVALVIPAVYAQVTHHKNPGHIESISLDISYILILTYAASLVLLPEDPRAPLRAHGRGRRLRGGPRPRSPGPWAGAWACSSAPPPSWGW